MARKSYGISWEETHGYILPDDRYSVCSSDPDCPGEVLEYCLTGSLKKAKKAFTRIRKRTELELITLEDRHEGTVIKRVTHPSR